MSLAALIMTIALTQAGTAAGTMPGAQTPVVSHDPATVAHFERCVAMIDTDAAQAYEEGMSWASLTHQLGGYRCAALALIAQDRPTEAARRLQGLAGAVNSESTGLRADLLSQAGNAWLLAREPSQARSAFTLAITTMHNDPSQLPDLLIDRARSYALEADYRHAEEDLSHALDLRPRDGLALRLRASARMHQNSFELAQADAEAAVALEPTNVDALLMRGHTIEARRTGHAVDEQ